MPVSFTCIKFCTMYWDTTSTWADTQEWSCAYYPAHSVFKLLKGTREMYLAEVVENLPHIWGSCDRLKVQDFWGCKEEKEWYDIWHQQPTWPGFGTRLQASIVPTLEEQWIIGTAVLSSIREHAIVVLYWLPTENIREGLQIHILNLSWIPPQFSPPHGSYMQGHDDWK